MSALYDLLKLILESILVKTIRIFHRHSREINSFLQSNNSVSRTNYYRIFALASIDIVLTLPIGIATIALQSAELTAFGHLPFYRGWTVVHTDWEPVSNSYEEVLEGGTSTVAQFYFVQWTSPILAFAIFGLFGVTSEARASYWRIIRTIGGRLGWKPIPLQASRPKSHSPLGDSEIGERASQDMSLSIA